MGELADKIKRLAEDNHARVVEIRRHIHQNPELSFQEHETSAYVRSLLDEWDISYDFGYATTGIVAELTGGNGKELALRADMDALPILEQNNVPYKSKNDGVMHACGHDVHTSSLLGAIWILNQLKAHIHGKIKFVFQPGEETFPGGASLMLEEGALGTPKPSGIIGQHVFPALPAGKVGFRGGLFMASADEIKMRISGKGGHGAVPHKTIDPIAISSLVISALQQVISRRADPLVPSVLSFGYIRSEGGTFNVIPEAVDLKGTFRTFDEEWRVKAHKLIKEMAADTASAHGAICDVDITVGYPHLINDEYLTNRCKSGAQMFLGADQVEEIPMRMTAEDFSFYTHHMPGCFYRLGIANEERNITSEVHTPTFDIDESALQTGAGLMAYLALNELQYLNTGN